jgi:hypothetical protein
MCSAHVLMSRDIYCIEEQLERLGETNQDNYSFKCFAHAQISRVWIVHVVEKNQNILEKFSAHVLMSRDVLFRHSWRVR